MRLSSKSELKKHLKDLFNNIEERNYTNALDVSHRLFYELKKYNMTRGKDYDQFVDLFSHLDFNLIVATDCDVKVDICLKSLKNIFDALREPSSNPLETLKEIYNEILNLYINLNPENANCLLDIFEEVRQLHPQMKELAGSSWVYYCALMQQIPICESSLLRVIKVQKLPSNSLGELENKFADLLSSINGCLSPPELDAKKIHQAYKKGVPLEEIAFGTGETTEDLRIMLQNEELLEEDSD